MPDKMDYSLLNQKNLSLTRKYISGRYYGPDRAATTSTGVAVGVLYAVPFWVADFFTADRLSAEVTVAAATAGLKLGIYKSSITDEPGVLEYESSILDASTTGVKEEVFSYKFTPGLYWLAFVNTTAAISVRALATTTHLEPIASTTFIGGGATQEPSCYYVTGVTGAFPSNWTSSVVGAAAPKLMVRVA